MVSFIGFQRSTKSYSSPNFARSIEDSEAEEQAKVPDCYRPVFDRIRRRYSSASIYDVPKDSKAEEQPRVQEGSCSPLTYYVPTDKSMIRRVYKSVAVIGRAHESVSVIRRALNSEAKPLVKYDVGSRSSGEGQNQTVAAIDDDSKAEEQAKIPDCYRPLLDIVQRRYSSASTYDVPKDSKAEEQPKVQDSRQVVVDEIQKGSCSPLTHYECRPADNFADWLAIVEEFNERMAAGSGTKLTPEEEEAKLRYGPCECCGKEKDHATKNCPLKTIRF